MTDDTGLPLFPPFLLPLSVLFSERLPLVPRLGFVEAEAEDVDDVKVSASFLLFFLTDSSSASETSRGRLSPTTPTAVDAVEESLVVSIGDLDSFVSSTALGEMEEEASLMPFSVPICALFSESFFPSFPSSLLVFSSLLFDKLADEDNPDEVVFSFSSILVNVFVARSFDFACFG